MFERMGAFSLLGAFLVASPAPALEDPTRPPRLPVATSAEIDEPGLALTAILGRGTERVAVIDGRSVRIGDAVGNATVARIGATLVELSGPSGPTLLTLFGPPVKTPARTEKEQR